MTDALAEELLGPAEDEEGEEVEEEDAAVRGTGEVVAGGATVKVGRRQKKKEEAPAPKPKPKRRTLEEEEDDEDDVIGGVLNLLGLEDDAEDEPRAQGHQKGQVMRASREMLSREKRSRRRDASRDVETAKRAVCTTATERFAPAFPIDVSSFPSVAWSVAIFVVALFARVGVVRPPTPRRARVTSGVDGVGRRARRLRFLSRASWPRRSAGVAGRTPRATTRTIPTEKPTSTTSARRRAFRETALGRRSGARSRCFRSRAWPLCL